MTGAPLSLLAIVRAVGGDLYDRGRRANVPAPGHSPADRSISLLLSGGRVVAHGFGSADWREALDDLRRRGLVDRQGRPSGSPGGPQRPEPAVVARAERAAAASALWTSALPIAPGTASHRHLAFRAIARTIRAGALRHHPAAPVSVYQPSAATRPALVAAVRDGNGDLTAVEMTYLGAGGHRALDLRLARKTVGLLPAGSAVRLDDEGPDLLVAEGVFSTLSAGEHFSLPGWALLSTTNLRRWSPPPSVSRVVIAADRGVDGLRSAAVLATSLRRAGVTAEVRPPPHPWSDWNDYAVAEARRRRSEGAKGRAGPHGRVPPAGAGDSP